MRLFFSSKNTITSTPNLVHTTTEICFVLAYEEKKSSMWEINKYGNAMIFRIFILLHFLYTTTCYSHTRLEIRQLRSDIVCYVWKLFYQQKYCNGKTYHGISNIIIQGLMHIIVHKLYNWESLNISYYFIDFHFLLSIAGPGTVQWPINMAEILYI